MKPIKVTCAIIEHNDKVLVVQRSKRMNLALKWEFPGGKIEDDESERDCLIREIMEELNLEINPQQRLTPSIFHYPNISIELIPFISELISGKLILSEHKQHKWLSVTELNDIDWASADMPIVKEYIDIKEKA